MAKGKRRSYTHEYKEEAVKLVTEQGYKISEASPSQELFGFASGPFPGTWVINL